MAYGPGTPAWTFPLGAPLSHPKSVHLNEYLHEQINAWVVRVATEENLSDFPEGLEHLLSTGTILDTGTQAVSKMEASTL